MRVKATSERLGGTAKLNQTEQEKEKDHTFLLLVFAS
jgi:hypothetical protein